MHLHCLIQIAMLNHKLTNRILNAPNIILQFVVRVISDLCAVAIGSNECVGVHVHILSYSRERIKRSNSKGDVSSSSLYWFILQMLFGHEAKKGIAYFLMVRERTADMLSRRHPNAPVSNCGRIEVMAKKLAVIFNIWQSKLHWGSQYLGFSPDQYAAPEATAGPWSYPEWNMLSETKAGYKTSTAFPFVNWKSSDWHSFTLFITHCSVHSKLKPQMCKCIFQIWLSLHNTIT